MLGVNIGVFRVMQALSLFFVYYSGKDNLSLIRIEMSTH